MDSSSHYKQHETTIHERGITVDNPDNNSVEDKAIKDTTDLIGSNTNDPLEQTSEAPQRTLIDTTLVPVPPATQGPSGLDEEHSGEVLMENTEDAVIY